MGQVLALEGSPLGARIGVVVNPAAYKGSCAQGLYPSMRDRRSDVVDGTVYSPVIANTGGHQEWLMRVAGQFVGQ